MTRTLSVELNPGVIYVSGTVNGVSCIWTKNEAGAWETTADRDEYDVYYIELTAINAAGTSVDYAFTAYYGLQLITNRTSQHVARVKALSAKGWDNMTDAEREEYTFSRIRGVYNYTDMNRVEGAVSLLSGKLRDLPGELKDYGDALNVAWDDIYDVPYDPGDYNLSTKTDWQNGETPSPEERARYLENVKTLRESLDYQTPELPESTEHLTASGANAIEQALEGLNVAISILGDNRKDLMDRAHAAFIYSGEAFSGEF